jgi:hypothetical protein
MEHSSKPHSRMEDWLANLPASGVRAVCRWERFCTFAREPERRKVGGDARVSVAGGNYEVDPDLVSAWRSVWADSRHAYRLAQEAARRCNCAVVSKPRILPAPKGKTSAPV